MEYNNPSEIVKDLSFGKDARNKIMHGVDKLASAVKSTLGLSLIHISEPTRRS